MGMTLRHFIALGVIAFVVAFIAVPLVKRLAFKLNAIDYPSARRVNTVPTPRMGGVAIFAGVFSALVVEVLGEQFLGWAGFYVSSGYLQVNHLGVMAGLTVITFVGAVDDVVSLSPIMKLVGQIVGASIIAASGVLLSSIMNPFGGGFISFGWVAYPLTVFYLVAFMNVINLVDGLDGLAGGIIVIASFTLFTIAFGKGRVEAAILAITLLGATLAFLRYNFNPASIFMGDSGSLFLGATLGVISLLGVMRSPAFIVLAAPLIIAAIPIMDTFAAIVRRLYHHQPIQQADKGHLHHVLLKEGFSTRKSVLIIHAWTAILALGAYLMSSSYGISVFALFVILALVSFAILYKIGIFDPVLHHYYNRRLRRSVSYNDANMGTANAEDLKEKD